MSYPRFLLFDSVGAVWSTQAALIGYFAGKAFADQPWVAFAASALDRDPASAGDLSSPS